MTWWRSVSVAVALYLNRRLLPFTALNSWTGSLSTGLKVRAGMACACLRMRRTKNNPVLLGEAGDGKTAIVEGLAQEIAAGNVSELLRDKKAITLDLALMVA